jgi:hypothetical protein
MENKKNSDDINNLINETKKLSISNKKEKTKIINKGTGAGGLKTNLYGKKFEEKTNNQKKLLDDGYKKSSFSKKIKNKYDYYLIKKFNDKTVVFVSQNGLKRYMKNKYNIELFRCPYLKKYIKLY